jgi:O-antigen ligase
MILPFGLFLLGNVKKVTKKLYFLASICLFTSANIITLSRGGFIGLITVLMYFWLRSSRKILTLAISFLLGLFISSITPDVYWDEVSSIYKEGTSEGTARDRIYMWKIGWEMYLDNFIFGVGQGNFLSQFSKYEGSRRLRSNEYQEGMSRAGRAAHSLYFTLFPELGTIGATLYFFMIIQIFKETSLIRRNKWNVNSKVSTSQDYAFRLSYAVEASLIGYLASSTFISTLYYPNFWVLMGFAVTLRKVVYNEENQSISENLHNNNYRKKNIIKLHRAY